ncbi:MAG: hypothetical protein QNJ81_01950 [Acidimicrobiia bacterium]|nr:hypothetical protein [Acidimicrobiia bacterium]
MTIKSLRTGIAAALGGAVLLAGLLVGASIALADDTEGAGVDEKNVENCRGHFHGLTEDIADELGIPLEDIKTQLRDGATLQEVADDLGVDLEQAISSVKDRILEELDERVAAGDISEERADAIRERVEDFELGEFPGPRGFAGFGHGFGDMLGFHDLDIDPSELREKLESGLSLDEALEEMGVDLEATLQDARDAVLERIDELVADGVITQERADLIKEMIESFDASAGFPFGARGFNFDFERFEDFDFGEFQEPHRRGFGFFFGDDAETDAENALFNV